MFTKSQTKIGDNEAIIFLSEDGKYYYSLTSVTNLIGKPASSASEYLESKAFKAMHGAPLTLRTYREGRVEYRLLTCEAASLYLFHWANKGNKKAVDLVSALMMESLQIRAARAFGEVTDPAVAKYHTFTDEELATKERRAYRQEHNLFQLGCLRLGYSPRQAHELLTVMVFGKTAEEVRELAKVDYTDPVWNDLQIGINHHPNPILWQVYREVKKLFLGYRKGNLDDRLRRAYLEVTQDLPLGS